MTTTVSLNSAFTLPVSITVNAIDITAFALVDTKVLDDGVSRESIYQLMSGDEEYPLIMRVGVYKNAKSNDGAGQTNVSIKIASFAQKADVDDIIWTNPEVWTLSKSAPGGNPFYDTDVDEEMVGALFTAYHHVSADVVQTTNLDELKFGVTNRILEHANSAA